MRRQAEACSDRASTVAGPASRDGPLQAARRGNCVAEATRAPGTGSQGGVAGSSAAEQVGVGPARLAADAVAVPHQAADLERREAVEVGADVGRLSLDLGVQGRRVFGRFDHVGNRGEDEAGRVLERLVLQLPDPVHEDVGGAQGGPDRARRRGGCPAPRIGLPTSLTRTPSSPLLSRRKQAWPVACRKAASSRCRFSQS